MTWNLDPHPELKAPEGPVCLVVMDGVGIAPPHPANAWHLADTPFLDELMDGPVVGALAAHGKAVGMPSDADMGNSEVGHNALGAGRVFDQGAGAETDVVKWRGELEVSKAAILRAEARVERARLDLSYTQVKSPIDGRTSRNLVDLGNLVGEGEPTLLTTVTRYDPIFAYFSLNERDFHGRTALHLAAWANQKDAVERLLDVGADVSVGAADGVQAIHFACMKGYLGMCARVFSNFTDLSLCIFIN